MKFAFPEFLFAFGVLLIPIIIHLFNFRKYKTLHFSSLRFLQNVEEQTRSTQRLKHILTLIARLLAFSCLVLAFAQPFIPKNGKKATNGNPVLAIYLDNSFSMKAKGVNGELLSQGRETTRKIIEDAPLETSFMLFSNQLSGIEQRIVNKQEALDRLDKISESPVNKDLGTVLSLQKDVLEKENWQGPRQYVFISDFQENSAKINQNLDSLGYYYPIQLKAQSTNNLYIDSVWFSSPLRKVNNNNELHVRIVNAGIDDFNNAGLKLKIENYERNLLVDIRAKSSVETVINYSDKSVGQKSGFVELNDKQIYFDDKFYFSYKVQENIEVLIVNGANGLSNPKLVYETDGYYTINEVGSKELKLNDVQNSDIIVLNALDELTSGQRDILTDFGKEGGSIFVIPSQNCKLNSYNSFFSNFDLPAFSKEKTKGLNLSKLNYEDGFFKGIFEEDPKNLNLPVVSKAYGFVSNSKFNAISLLSFQDREPLLLKSKNDYKIYVLSTALNIENSKLINHALFPSILLRAGELSQRDNALYAILGESNEYKVIDKKGEEGAIHLKKGRIDFIPPVLKKANYNYVQLNNISAVENLEDGVYDVFKNESLGAMALNYNRAESNIQATNKEELITMLNKNGAKSVQFNQIEEVEEIANFEMEKPQEYWRILLILCIVFLIAEMLLLKFLKA